MPTIPSRYSARGSREASDLAHNGTPFSLELSEPRAIPNLEPRDTIQRRAATFNPALIPLLPLSTLNNLPADMFLSTRHPGGQLSGSTGTLESRDLEVRQQGAMQQMQTTGFIPYTYKGLNAGPKPGVVVGIVLGAVAGAIFAYWLFVFVLFQAPRSGLIEGDEQEVVIERHHRSSGKGHKRRKRRRRSHHSSRSRSRSIELSEHKTERRQSPIPSPSRARRTERIIRTETKRTERSQAPPIVEESIASPTTERRETVIEERSERRVVGDDTVEVIEQHDDISDRQRRSSKKPSGFRTVDPNEYGGGNYAQREVYRKSSRR